MTNKKSILFALMLVLPCSMVAQSTPAAEVQEQKSTLARVKNACDYLYCYLYTPFIVFLPELLVLLNNNPQAAHQTPTYTKICEEYDKEITELIREMGMNTDVVSIQTTYNTKIQNPKLSMGHNQKILVAQSQKSDPDMVANSYGAILCIGEQFYNSLPKAERRALVAHELSQIKHYATFQKMLTTMGIVGGSILAGKKLLTPKVMKYFDNAPYSAAGAVFASLYTAVAAYNFFSRRNERRADIEGATLLDCYEGSINLLERYRNVNLKWRKSSFFGKVFIDSEGNNRFHCTTPKLTERITYLREQATVQEAVPAVAPAA